MTVIVQIAIEIGDDKGLFELGLYKTGQRRIDTIQFAHHKLDQTTLSNRHCRNGPGVGRNTWCVDRSTDKSAQRFDQLLRSNPEDQVLKIG